jgi:ferrous iron transport protein B
VRAGTIIFAMSIVIWALCYFPRSEHVAQDVTRQTVSELAAARGVPGEQAEALIADDAALQAHLDAAIGGAYLEQSYMGRLGKAVQPVFAPAGFDWKITVGVLASFPAREVIISTLGIIYNLGADVDEQDEGLKSSMQASVGPGGEKVFTPLVAVAIMVFFALCSQCMATLATIAKEASWRWAVFSFVYMTVLAWVGAVAVFQVGSMFV